MKEIVIEYVCNVEIALYMLTWNRTGNYWIIVKSEITVISEIDDEFNIVDFDVVKSLVCSKANAIREFINVVDEEKEKCQEQ